MEEYKQRLNYITVSGAREHNLKNITVRIPRDQLTRDHRAERLGQVVAGVRHALRRGPAEVRGEPVGLCAAVPGADAEAGRGPHRGAVARRSRSSSARPARIRGRSWRRRRRSTTTCACSTPASGTQHCHQCGRPIARQSAEEIVDQLLKLPARHARCCCWRRWCEGRKGEHEEVFESARQAGVRARAGGRRAATSSRSCRSWTRRRSTPSTAVVDRLVITDKIRARLTDSVELALKQGEGVLIALFQDAGGDTWTRAAVLREERLRGLRDQLRGRCSRAQLLVQQPVRRVPDLPRASARCWCSTRTWWCRTRTLSLEDGRDRGVAARRAARWRSTTRGCCARVAKHYGFDLEHAVQRAAREVPRDPAARVGRGGDRVRVLARRGVPQVQQAVRRRAAEPAAALRGDGQRLHAPEAAGLHEPPAVHGLPGRAAAAGERWRARVGGQVHRGRHGAVRSRDAVAFFADLALTEQEEQIAREVLKEIRQRLQFLVRRGAGLPDAGPRERHALRRRGAAHPAGDADRRGAGRRALRAGRAEHRPAPARQREADRARSRACATSATRWSWSSTTSRRSARRTT